MASADGDRPRSEKSLFIDASHIYRQVGCAHREWTPAQIGFFANLVRLHRGEALDFSLGGDAARAKLEEIFGEVGRVTPCASSSEPKRRARNDAPYLTYRDNAGLSRAATLKEIEAQADRSIQAATWAWPLAKP